MLNVISADRLISFPGLAATFCALLYAQFFQTFNMCTTSLQRNGAMHPYSPRM